MTVYIAQEKFGSVGETPQQRRRLDHGLVGHLSRQDANKLAVLVGARHSRGSSEHRVASEVHSVQAELQAFTHEAFEAEAADREVPPPDVVVPCWLAGDQFRRCS